MSYYELLLFLHVLTAVIWIGGGFMVQVFVWRAEQTDDAAAMKRLADDSKFLAQRVFIPSSLFVLLFGILLTIEGPWSFSDLWISLGLAGYAFSFLVGILFLEPQGKRIAEAMEAHGPASSQAAREIRRINAVQRVELVILFLVVAVMAIKPTGDDLSVLLAGAVLVAAAAVAGVRALRGAGAVEAASAEY